MPRVSDAKERLMSAAIDLIWENSYGSTSVDAICEKAGVKKGSFYYFFASKSELAVTAIEADWQDKKAGLDEIFSPVVPPLDRLRGLFAWGLERQIKLKEKCGFVCGCPLFTLGSEVGTQDELIRAKVEEMLGRMVKYYESAIRDAHAQGLIHAPNAEAKARMLFAYVEGVLTQSRIQNDLQPVRDVAEGAMELLGAKPEAVTS